MSTIKLIWKPIETAPRDGRPLLLFLARADEHRIGSWEAQHDVWIDQHDYMSLVGIFTPTHWMPLPEPPQ